MREIPQSNPIALPRGSLDERRSTRETAAAKGLTNVSHIKLFSLAYYCWNVVTLCAHLEITKPILLSIGPANM